MYLCTCESYIMLPDFSFRLLKTSLGYFSYHCESNKILYNKILIFIFKVIIFWYSIAQNIGRIVN